MSARKKEKQRNVKSGQGLGGNTIAELRGTVASLTYKILALNRENADVNRTLADSTAHLKQMCDLCDKQRAQIGAQHAEVDHLQSLVKILVRVVEKGTQ